MHGNLSPGTPIFTADGEELGKIKEIRGDYFKVDAPMAPDYWLACNCIDSAGTGRIQLAVSKDEVDANRVGEPASLI